MSLYKEVGYYYPDGPVTQNLTNVNSVDELERILQDGKVIECLLSLSSQIVHMGWEVISQNPNQKEICQKILDDKGLTVLAMEMSRILILGMCVHELVYERDSKGFTVPKNIILRENSIIEYEYKNGQMLAMLTLPGKLPTPITPRKWMISRYWSIPNTDPYGNGLGEALAPFVYVRSRAISHLDAISEEKVIPTRIGYYPATASDTEILDFFGMVKNLSKAKSMVLPESYKVDEFGRTGDKAYETSQSLFEKCNQEISMIILGENTAGQGLITGAYAKDAISMSLRLARSQLFAKLVEFYVNRTLFKWIQELNFPNEEPAKLNFKIREEVAKPEDIIDTEKKKN